MADLEATGLVGERTNKLISYLSAVSRKLPKPLAVIIQSSSAAGKSALMDAVLSLVPREYRLQYSAMTGQSLFYMGEVDLKPDHLAGLALDVERRLGPGHPHADLSTLDDLVEHLAAEDGSRGDNDEQHQAHDCDSDRSHLSNLLNTGLMVLEDRQDSIGGRNRGGPAGAAGSPGSILRPACCRGIRTTTCWRSY